MKFKTFDNTEKVVSINQWWRLNKHHIKVIDAKFGKYGFTIEYMEIR